MPIARIPAVVLAVLTLVATGCRTPQRSGDAQSAYSVDRARAAVRLAQASDTASLAELVGLLADEDRTVRWYAIRGLQRRTGETHGYRFHDPPAARAAAIGRWQAALRAGASEPGMAARGGEAAVEGDGR